MNPDTIRKLLTAVLSFREPCTSEQLALEVYAHSKAWKRSRKIVASAAGVAGRLRARGLLRRTGDGRWYVSEAGQAYLAQVPDPSSEGAVTRSRAPVSALARRQDRASAPQLASPMWVPWTAAPGGFLWFDGQTWWWPDGYGGWWPWATSAS